MKQLRSRHPVVPTGRVFVCGLLAGLAFVILLGACADAAPTAAPVQHRATTARDSGAVTATGALPPTWTPTATWTPRPPTLTPTITLTPTETPTPDAARACEAFDLFSAPAQGVKVAYEGRIAFAWRGARADAVVRVEVIQRATGQGILVEWPPQQAFNMPVDMISLPEAGVYDWELTLYFETLGDLCRVKGWFERLPPQTNTPTATEAANRTDSPNSATPAE